MSQTAFKGESFTGPSLSLVSSSGKRMFPRVDQPLAVEFDTGERFQASDWSVAGFSLSDEGFASAKGAVHRVWLSIGLTDCNIVVEADAKVSWMSGGGARGFRFVGLSSDKARILDHFIESGDRRRGRGRRRACFATACHEPCAGPCQRRADPRGAQREAGLEAAPLDRSGPGRGRLRRRAAPYRHDGLCRGRGRSAAVACPGKRLPSWRRDRGRDAS